VTALADALLDHTPRRDFPAGTITGCDCGWTEPGASWAEHAAQALTPAVNATAADELTALGYRLEAQSHGGCARLAHGRARALRHTHPPHKHTWVASHDRGIVCAGCGQPKPHQGSPGG
jgi:hypothetical protein